MTNTIVLSNQLATATVAHIAAKLRKAGGVLGADVVDLAAEFGLTPPEFAEVLDRAMMTTESQLRAVVTSMAEQALSEAVVAANEERLHYSNRVERLRTDFESVRDKDFSPISGLPADLDIYRIRLKSLLEEHSQKVKKLTYKRHHIEIRRIFGSLFASDEIKNLLVELFKVPEDTTT